MKAYELVLVLDPGTTSEKQKALLEKIGKFVAEIKGKVVKTNEWGKKQLAYTISKKAQGFYWLQELELEESSVASLDRKLKVENGIIRFLLCRTDRPVEKTAKPVTKKAKAK